MVRQGMGNKEPAVCLDFTGRGSFDTRYEGISNLNFSTIESVFEHESHMINIDPIYLLSH